MSSLLSDQIQIWTHAPGRGSIRYYMFKALVLSGSEHWALFHFNLSFSDQIQILKMGLAWTLSVGVTVNLSPLSFHLSCKG